MTERDGLGMLDWAEAEAEADGPEPSLVPATFAGAPIPPVIAQAGPDAARRFIEFFTAHIRNPNTRAAYARAVSQFLRWCDARAIRLRDLNPILVATYVEQLPTRQVEHRSTLRLHASGTPYTATVRTEPLSPPAVKQHLAAIRMLFDCIRHANRI